MLLDQLLAPTDAYLIFLLLLEVCKCVFEMAKATWDFALVGLTNFCWVVLREEILGIELRKLDLIQSPSQMEIKLGHKIFKHNI